MLKHWNVWWLEWWNAPTWNTETLDRLIAGNAETLPRWSAETLDRLNIPRRMLASLVKEIDLAAPPWEMLALTIVLLG